MFFISRLGYKWYAGRAFVGQVYAKCCMLHPLYIQFVILSPKSSHLSSMYRNTSLTKTLYYIFMLDQLFSQNRSPYSCTVTKKYCLTQRHFASRHEHEFLCTQQILISDSFCGLIFFSLYLLRYGWSLTYTHGWKWEVRVCTTLNFSECNSVPGRASYKALPEAWQFALQHEGVNF